MKQQDGTIRILIAGFGGQGVLFLGKLIALAASGSGKHVTWLPSYGPEMRGGTANCAVIVSEDPIGSPIVSAPDLLVAMNLPSYRAFEPKVMQNGLIVFDSSLIESAPARNDVSYGAVPASRLAAEASLDGLANMILLGKSLQLCLPFDERTVLAALQKAVPQSRERLIQANRSAIALGLAYRAEHEGGEITMRAAAEQARRAV